MLVNEENYTPKDIFGEVMSDDELKGFAKGYGLPYENTLNDKWHLYSLIYGLDNGFDVARANSFAHMVALFLSGMGKSCGTEMYFNEEKIEFFIIDLLNNYGEMEGKNKIEQLFFDVFTLYKEHIEDYAYKNERLQIRCSISLLSQFHNVDGETSAKKLENLLNVYFRHCDDDE